jgi:hypothetical protein
MDLSTGSSEDDEMVRLLVLRGLDGDGELKVFSRVLGLY